MLVSRRLAVPIYISTMCYLFDLIFSLVRVSALLSSLLLSLAVILGIFFFSFWLFMSLKTPS